MTKNGVIRLRQGRAFSRLEFHNISIYRGSFWMRFIFIFIMMYSMGHVWRILYYANPERMGVSLSEIVTYAVMGVALEAVLHFGGPQYYIMDQVRRGTIEMDILKPIDFQFYMLAKHIGFVLMQFFMIVLPSLVVAYFFFGFNMPSFINGMAFLLSLFFACLITFFLKFLLGLISMVTMNIQNIMFGYNATLRFFSGQIVPLWLFPGVLGLISTYLPFRAIYAIPISLYIGRYNGVDIGLALSAQLFWVGALWLVSRLFMKYVFKRLLIQGG